MAYVVTNGRDGLVDFETLDGRQNFTDNNIGGVEKVNFFDVSHKYQPSPVYIVGFEFDPVAFILTCVMRKHHSLTGVLQVLNV